MNNTKAIDSAAGKKDYLSDARKSLDRQRARLALRRLCSRARISEHRPKEYDGLVAGRYSNPAPTGEEVYVQPVPDEIWGAGYSPPYWDPFEMLKKSQASWPFSPPTWNGVMNQLFGDRNIATGLPSPAGGRAKMRGFLQDYYTPSMIDWKGHDVLWTYKRGQLTVINGVARQFAVSDRWFCSVPSQTNPRMEGLPVVATRSILGRNETMAGVQANVERYRRDPEKFEVLLEASLSRG